jgi:hypothetical protein
MNTDDEFYIGWESKAPIQTARRVRRIVVTLLTICVVLAGAFAMAQRTIGRAVFEWGTVKEFSGTFKSQPYPHLVASNATYYLVNPILTLRRASTGNPSTCRARSFTATTRR